MIMTTNYHTPLSANDTVSITDINARLADLDNGIVSGVSSGSMLSAVLYDLKATTVDGQTLPTDTWTTRELNTEVDPFDIVSLSSNQFTPISGTYVIIAESLSYTLYASRIRLYNQTQSSVVFTGMSGFGSAGDNVFHPLYYIFTANGTDAYSIDMWNGGTAGGNNTGGTSTNDGESEVYTIITLLKVG